LKNGDVFYVSQGDDIMILGRSLDQSAEEEEVMELWNLFETQAKVREQSPRYMALRIFRFFHLRFSRSSRCWRAVQTILIYRSQSFIEHQTWDVTCLFLVTRCYRYAGYASFLELGNGNAVTLPVVTGIFFFFLSHALPVVNFPANSSFFSPRNQFSGLKKAKLERWSYFIPQNWRIIASLRTLIFFTISKLILEMLIFFWDAQKTCCYIRNFFRVRNIRTFYFAVVWTWWTVIYVKGYFCTVQYTVRIIARVV